MNPILRDAIAELYDGITRRWNDTAEYIEAHDLDIATIDRFAGSLTVTEIVKLPHRRFALPDGHGAETVTAAVVEALASDGRTPMDLCAWSLGDPRDIRTLYGQCAVLGLSQAFDASTYIFDEPLVIHKTAQDWLRAGCDGACIITPRLAARTLMDVPGPIAAQDAGHAAALRKMIQAPAERVKIVIPETRQAA